MIPINPFQFQLKIDRAAYIVRIRHAYDLGGFDITPSKGIDLDELGLEWVRTITLVHRKNKIGYRMIEPTDLHVIFPHWEWDTAKIYM